MSMARNSISTVGTTQGIRGRPAWGASSSPHGLRQCSTETVTKKVELARVQGRRYLTIGCSVCPHSILSGGSTILPLPGGLPLGHRGIFYGGGGGRGSSTETAPTTGTPKPFALHSEGERMASVNTQIVPPHQTPNSPTRLRIECMQNLQTTSLTTELSSFPIAQVCGT